MKPQAFFINMARGGVVDEHALIQALEQKQIAGAGLDVFEQEPFVAGDDRIANQLSLMPNVVMTPHIAGYTHEALYKMSKTLLDKIIRS